VIAQARRRRGGSHSGAPSWFAGAQRVLETGSREEQRGDGAAEHVPAPRRIDDLIECRLCMTGAGISSVRIGLPVKYAAPRFPASTHNVLQPWRSASAAIAREFGPSWLISSSFSCTTVETAEPWPAPAAACAARAAVGFLSEEEAVQVCVNESWKAAPAKSCGGIEAHLETEMKLTYNASRSCTSGPSSGQVQGGTPPLICSQRRSVDSYRNVTRLFRFGDFDESGVRCQVSQGAQELIRPHREIATKP